MESYNEEALAL